MSITNGQFRVGIGGMPAGADAADDDAPEPVLIFNVRTLASVLFDQRILTGLRSAGADAALQAAVGLLWAALAGDFSTTGRGL